MKYLRVTRTYNSGVNGRNSSLSDVGYGHDVFWSESEFSENLFIIECQYQTDGFCP